jgi:hypothetical protein
VSFSAPATAWYPWFKAALFALLAANTAVYAISGSTSEALDSIAWLVLLAAFELETGMAGRFATGRAAVALRTVRLAAAAAILAAGLGYVRDREWLDAANTGLWVGVVALLEIEVRYPRAAMRHRSWFATAAAALYSGLGVVVLAWMWQRSWFDAYDAALWLVAFAAMELALLRRGASPSADRASPGNRAGRRARTDAGA